MKSSAQNQSNLSQEERERFNRARDFFGDCIQRWEDWLALLRMSKFECVAEGRAALIYHLRVFTKRSTPEMIGASPEGRFSNEGGHFDNFFIVLNADSYDSYHREIRNQQLMLIDNICLFNRPKRKVPLAVRLYYIADELMDSRCNLSLFESGINLSYKIFPAIQNWEPRPFRLQASMRDDLKPHDIESAAKVMVDLPNNQGGFISEFLLRFVNRDQEFSIDVPSFAFDNFNRVQLGGGERLHENAEFADVLFGPFDFEPRGSKTFHAQSVAKRPAV